MGVDVSTQKERERMAVRPWEVITGSEEFQAIADNALEGLGPVLASWDALAESEEFKVSLETAVLSLEPFIGAWGGARSVPGVQGPGCERGGRSADSRQSCDVDLHVARAQGPQRRLAVSGARCHIAGAEGGVGSHGSGNRRRLHRAAQSDGGGGSPSDCRLMSFRPSREP